MPRFYFHVFNDETTLDEEGQELPDLKAARALAIKEARNFIGEGAKEGRITLSHHIGVQNDDGELLFNVTFGEAIEIRL